MWHVLKKKKKPMCGEIEQMNQKPSPIKRKLFYGYKVGENAMKISLISFDVYKLY